jgi:hypothetical protein
MESVILRVVGALMVSLSVSVSLEFSYIATGILSGGLYMLFSTTGDSK